jgi:hypothetical protein
MALVAKLSIDPSVVPGFSLQHGVLRKQGRIWIGHNPSLHQKLIQACHSSALGGHSGVPATYIRMKHMFAWKGLKSAVYQYVRTCVMCQQAKPDRSKQPGLLQPLDIPSGAWQTVSMDFVEGLPTFGNANCILVVVDSFTKYGHFIQLHHPFTALSVAKLFLHNIYKLHDMPLAIVSDRDRIFTSQLWKELFSLAGVKLQMSFGYHPQSDGQTERLNQTIETFLRCFVSACPAKWTQWLSLAEFWYNSSHHSAINTSPFEALYGYKPRHFGMDAMMPIQSVDLSTWLRLQERSLMDTLVKQHLHRAKTRMKKQADKSRSERSFQFFGPFRILEKIGPVAYKLQLPDYSSIHPVFHVSQLKKAVTAEEEVLSSFPDDLALPRVPKSVLQKKSGVPWWSL